jgi:PAS domain S-box-containing protein
VVRVDGSLGWTLSRAVPLTDANGGIVEWLGATQDITARKKAQDQIREASERLRFMAEAMPQKITTARPDGSVDYMNAQWMEFTGLSWEQLRGWGWRQITHPDDLEKTEKLWRRSLESGEPYSGTRRLRRADGEYRWHLSRAHAMRDREGKITMWIGSTTEIHDQVLKEQELRRANQALERFAYSASHDLQEPIRSVRVFSELLTTKCRDKLEGDALVYLKHVNAAASRMEILVKDLLAYAQTSLLEKPSQLVDSTQCVRTALANLAGVIAESGAIVDVEPLPDVCVHATHLQQLFQNLVGNAIKYRRKDEAPVIHISATRQLEAWLFSIRDNGIGIELEFKQQIFELFKRLHTKDRYSGTGIGLAICQRIVEYYHGQIWVESEPGRGSTFHFTLPSLGPGLEKTQAP